MSTGNRPRRTSTESEGEKSSDKANDDEESTSVNRMPAKDFHSNNITSKNIDGSGEFIGNVSEMGFQVDIQASQGFCGKRQEPLTDSYRIPGGDYMILTFQVPPFAGGHGVCEIDSEDVRRIQKDGTPGSVKLDRG